MPDLNAVNEIVAFAHSIPELMQMLRVGRTHLYVQINSGALPARKIGRRTLVLHDDLLVFLSKLPVIGK